ncbi:putative ribonuclease H-like domain-containing protein [Tanacetum coccineum]|uniref:Ribonuclease H-like domain-containing protein n=1 Tax=Tanacetum coccineum TaxID=301880 RepID=A0ABQ5C4Q1_9ASTR
MTDAKEKVLDAIKSRFGGNDESKKDAEEYSKATFEDSLYRTQKGLHKGYDRFQSLLSQLEIHGAGVSTEDANQKFLRSLPSAWPTTSSSSTAKCIKCLWGGGRTPVVSSTNDVSTAYSVSNTSGQNSQYEQTSSYSLLANQSSCPQLDHEDLEQLDEFDLEEMDLKWQVAMISMRMKKFYKKTGRKLQFDAKEPVGFDKTKVECYNCHKTGHFARECRTKGNQDSRRRDAWNSGNKDGRRSGKQEDSKALVTIDGEGVDWTSHSEEEEDYALMACNSSGSDTEVTSCSNECKESYAKLKKLYDAQREQLSDASIEIKAYTQGLKKVEAQLVAHQQGQLWYEEKIRFMKIDLDDKTDVLTYHKKLLAEAQKEKEDLKAKVEKWHNSSKNLGKLLNTQMSANDKFGLGYGDHIYDGILSYENEVLQSVFKGKESDFKNPPLYDRFVTAGGMNVVPSPMTGNYMPSGPNVEIDYSQFTYGPKQTQPSEFESQTSEFDTCESNISTEPSELVSEPVVNESNVECQPKVWSDAPIIEEYESDSEDEHESLPTKEQETPSFANQQVKTHRETVKNHFTHSKNPKVDKKELGYGFTARACFVCGSLNHLIRDCDFHEKRMAKQAVLNNRLKRNSSQREIRPIWNNVQRVNHQDQFVPTAVLTRTGKIPVDTARASSAKNVSTARHSFNRQAVLTSTAMKVNTIKPIVNRVKPANTQPSESETQTSEFDTCKSNISTETPELVSEPVVNESNVACQPKVWSNAPIIEEYESDSKDEETLKNHFTHSKNPKVSKKELGYGFNARACFVCGSLNHLIRDCDFHEKRMTKQAELNNGLTQEFTVLTRTGKIPVDTARASSAKNVSTARHSFNRQAVLTSTAMKVNTIKPIVNRVKPANDYPHRALQNKGIVDSGCSRHMTGNKAYLAEYQDFNGGLVAFGGSKGYITGKGKIKTGKLDFEDVCFVKELQHFNLFFVSQMCDKKNKVLFTDSECLVLSPKFKLPDENQVLLRIPRQNNMYSFNLENIVPSGGLACLIAKATIDESNKWHRRLGHVNYKNLNKLVKGNLVRGLPSKIFQNDHTCVACQKGKQHKASCKAKSVSSISHSLQLLHMDLFGPTSVRSLNHKTYCLNKDFIEFCGSKGIKREYSNARTLQQNGVAERKNMTLIEAARTMLADSFLPNTFWAEGVSTSCYVLNRVLVTKPHNKTPYELVTGKIPIISYIRPFGCHVTILNTIDYLGKFDGKSDKGFLVGYSLQSKAFRVYNLETKRVEENLHITFLENKPNVAGKGPTWLFDLDYLTDSMNYQPVRSENRANKHEGPQEATQNAGTEDIIDAGDSEKEDESAQDYFVLPIWSSYSSTIKRSRAEDAGAVPHKHPDLKTDEKPVDKEDQVFLDELERLKRQEKDDNDAAEALRKEFAQETENLLIQVGAAKATSTNIVNTVSTPVSTASPYDGLSLSDLTNPEQDDSEIPALEDIYQNPTYDIFTNSSFDDEGAVADFTNLESVVNVSPIPTLRIHSIHPSTLILGDPKSAVQTRSKVTKSSRAHAFISYVQKQRRNNHKDFQHCLFACFLSQNEPKKISEALEDESWIDAMQEELLQFKIQKVWILVDLPYRKKAIGTKWVYRNNKDERGVVVRNKARLVAQGHRQEEGIDYDEVFAHVARIEAIRIFLAFASYMGFIVYQMDVKSAFLYGKIDEEVYMSQPPGFLDPKYPQNVYKVVKALYGLHQAPRAWYATLSTFLLKNGYRRGTIDKTLFLKKDKHDIILISDESMESYYFLGFSQQKEDGIFISQDKYVAEILKKFDFVTPKTSHLSVVKRIFRYLKGKPKLGLWYPRVSSIDLEAYSDSDYAGANLERKSTTGGCQFLGRRLISWQCKKQTIVATSTTEAEYVAAASCCGQILWIQNQMLDYGFNFMNTKIYIDNECTICIIKNPVYHSKTKHINIRHHFIRDAYEKKLIQVLKIHTDDNVADLLTKAFDVSSSLGFRESLGRALDGTDALMLPKLFILWLATVSNDSVELVSMGKFWTSAKSKIINNVRHITAKVDGKPVSISEASIRSDLLFDDADGIDSLPNQAIFDAIQLIGHLDAKKKFVMYPRFISIFLDKQLENVPIPLDHFLLNALTSKVFSFMVKKGKHFSGKVTPLFASMLVQPIEDEGAPSKRPSEAQPTPSPPHPSEATVDPQSDPSPRPSPFLKTHYPDSIPKVPGGNHGDQAKKIQHLSTDQEAQKAIPTCYHTLQSMDEECLIEAKIGRKEILKEKLDAKGKENAKDVLSTEDVLSTAQQKVSTDKEKVSTDRPIVSTNGSKVSTNKEKDSTDRTDEAVQEKGERVEFKDLEETERPRPTSTRSLLTLKPLPKIDPKDKGKKKIEEEDESESESDGIPEAEKKFKQLASDEEMARKVQEEWEGEEERKRLAEEEATNDALIRNYDDIKARIEADRLLAEKLQEEEREQFTIEERAKFLHDTIAAQRKFLAQQRSEAIRNRPPTKNQLRNQMMTYLKHVGNFKHSDLKTKKFEEIQALYEKIKRSDEDFISIGSAEDERLIKKMNEKGIDSSKDESVKEEGKEEEGTKKGKGGHIKMIARKKKRSQSDVDSDDEHKKCLKIVTFESILDSEIMEKKSVIARLNKVSSPDGDYLVMYKANGNFRAFNYLMEVLHIFNRQDLFHFDFWSGQQDWNIVTWRLYESCGVCILEFEDRIVIHMLVERRYPLSKDLLQRMLDLGLEVERESSVALDLIRFIKQYIDEE